jgi:endonuclease-3
MRKQERIRLVFDELERRYAGADTELVYHTPFQLLIAVVMSAQATDKQVNKVTATLFDRVKHPQDVLAM